MSGNFDDHYNIQVLRNILENESKLERIWWTTKLWWWLKRFKSNERCLRIRDLWFYSLRSCVRIDSVYARMKNTTKVTSWKTEEGIYVLGDKTILLNVLTIHQYNLMCNCAQSREKKAQKCTKTQSHHIILARRTVFTSRWCVRSTFVSTRTCFAWSKAHTNTRERIYGLWEPWAVCYMRLMFNCI